MFSDHTLSFQLHFMLILTEVHKKVRTEVCYY